MSSYDPYDDGRSEYAPARSHDDRRHQRDLRYAEPRDSYAKPQVVSRDLVPRGREDSDLSIEEIHRDFPPPTYTRDPYRGYDGDRRSRSARDRGFDRDYDRHAGKASRAGSVYYEEERKRRRVLSNQEKILAAVVGGALAVGGKELYDRREARHDGHGIHRNALSSAALGAAGAFAAYQGADFYNKHANKEDKKALMAHRGGDLYSDDDSDADPRDKKSRKNFLESALAAAGLGGAVKALSGHDDRQSDTRSRRGGSHSRSRSRSRSGSHSRGEKSGKGKTNKVQQAAMASLIAGATEAFRVAREPGGWKGEKAKRVLTAAAGAAAVDAAQDNKSSKLGIAESVIGGLLGNRLVNGSRRNIEEDKRTGRSRSRSRARSDAGGGSGGGGVSGLAALATAGLGALGAKKLYDNHERSRSRRRQSADSRDSRTRSPDRSRRSRSRSVVDTARRGLAKLGLGNDDEDEPPRRRGGSSHHHHHHRRDSADSYDDYPSDRRRGGGHRDRDRDYGRGGKDDYDDRDRSIRRRSGSGSRRTKGGSKSDSDSDLGSSSEDEKKAKKMKGKQIITTGLAAVATIHAAHNVYQSMEKRRSRNRAVKEGRLSPEEAKKLKTRALLQDAASVGIAALGIKGAISELKEVREVNHEMKEWQQEKVKRHQRRLERQQRSRSTKGDSRGADDDLKARASNRSSSMAARASRYDDEPQYIDESPYTALPAPPVGSEYRGHDGDYRN
ncbi:hypothetical protein SPI_09196 [Niveomyces insectorum RCEF 264]|uniref:DUF3824 domain-containing protein n=1 Tax=Niveomyces insectorum RCEF 264 TaxID=1081102 RepID=A0A167M050_9HYPO|nr:hypothetical protein SPI_09196 [Niveomyces insectorum RCEF 264]